jgi:hypothetical protein
MEDQVGQAALAMMSPSTDTTTRRQASQFLEDWTQTPEAWEVYAKWLHSYRILLENPANDGNGNGNGNSKRTQTPDHQIAMQLLCLTMLQTKIRKELPRQQPNAWHPHVPHVRQELWEYLRQPSLSLDPSLIMPCCICNAAIIVRCGLLPEFVTHANANVNASANNGGNQELSPEASLRLLACIPSEMESCQDLTAQQVTEQLVPHLEPVLDTIRRGLVEPSTVLQAEYTHVWGSACRIAHLDFAVIFQFVSRRMVVANGGTSRDGRHFGHHGLWYTDTRSGRGCLVECYSSWLCRSALAFSDAQRMERCLSRIGYLDLHLGQ